jgi:hypothetical protein
VEAADVYTVYGGPGSGLRPGRKRFLCQLPLWFCMCKPPLLLMCILPGLAYIGLEPPRRCEVFGVTAERRCHRQAGD